MEIRRLFWGFEITAQWPQFPRDGRQILPKDRHATIAFLGNVDYDMLKPFINNYEPEINIQPSGIFNRLILLPNEKKSRIISLGGHINNLDMCMTEVNRIKKGMSMLGFKIDERDWLFHVTIARKPFNIKLWKGLNILIPFRLSGICLYQSIQSLIYEKLHTFPIGFNNKTT
ncbi:MAG: hypothetical protein NTY22_05875 [Proteobacteria bacterium]|nr:hypothetical protein [Pseudomonadota bacterium]